MFQALVVRVQQEVLEAVGDVMIGQKLHIVLIELELQRMLLHNLRRRWTVIVKRVRAGWVLGVGKAAASLRDRRDAPL